MYSIRFDAAGEYLRKFDRIPTPSNFTIAAWVYMVNAANYRSIFSLGGSTDTTMYAAVKSTQNNLTLWNGVSASQGNALADDIWVHIAMSCSGTGVGNLLAYQNGVQDVSHAGNANVVNDEIRLGYNVGGDAANLRVAAVKVYQRVLSANEILLESKQYCPVSTVGLTHWLPGPTPFGQIGGPWVVSGALSVDPGPPIPWALYNKRRTIDKITAAGGVFHTGLLTTLGAGRGSYTA